jgi:hypothetical protein
MPKFDPMTESAEENLDVSMSSHLSEEGGGAATLDDDGSPVKVNRVNKVQGMHLKRPMGNKRAKFLEKTANQKQKLEYLKIKVLKNIGDKIGEPTERLATVIETASRNEQKIALISSLVNLGKTEEAGRLASSMVGEFFGPPVPQALSPSRLRMNEESASIEHQIDTMGPINLDADSDEYSEDKEENDEENVFNEDNEDNESGTEEEE